MTLVGQAPIGHLFMTAPTLAKDSKWLTLEVCREHARSKCPRSGEECRFAHPPPNVEIQSGRVVCCYDSIKGRCQRQNPGCKYFHPPSHLREVLLQNGRQNLMLRHVQWQRQVASYLPLSNLVPMQMMLNQQPIVSTQNNISTLLQSQCLSWPNPGLLPAQTLRPTYEGTTNVYLPPPPSDFTNSYELLGEEFQNLDLNQPIEKKTSPSGDEQIAVQPPPWSKQILQPQMPMCLSLQCKPLPHTMDLMSKSQFLYDAKDTPHFYATPPMYIQNSIPQWQFISPPGLPMSFCPTVIPQY